MVSNTDFLPHAEFNGEYFKAYRMLIFNLELELFIIKYGST